MWERVIDWFSGSGLIGRDRLAQYHVDEFCDSMLSDLMGDAWRGDEYIDGVVDDARFSVGEDIVSAEIDQVNDRFNNELQQQIDGTLPKGHIYKLGMPSEILLSAGFPNMPIEMSSTRLEEKSKQENHPFEISEMKNLVKELQSPIAVFKYGNNAKNVIIAIEYQGEQFLIGVHFNQNRNGIEVSSIRGIFPKTNAKWLNWIIQGKADYLDKEKIQTIINQQRTNLADVEYLDLDLVAKIVKDFENPSVEKEKSNRDVTEDERNNRFEDNVGTFSNDDVDVRFSMSPATGVSAGDVNGKIKHWLHEFRLWLRRGSGKDQSEISSRFGRELLGRGINGRLMRVVESWSNGYISLHRVFTHLNEARVKSGLKPYEDVMDLKWLARLT